MNTTHTASCALGILVLTLLFVGGLQYTLAAWTGPLSSPPGNNTSAPINTSGTSQTKAGAFWGDGGFFTAAGGVFTGNGVWASKYCDEDGNGCVDAPITSGGGATPSGAVMFFNLSSCPSGWTELTGARGRVIVGLPSGGTLAGTQGTALTNLGTRAITQVPSHNHTVDPPNTGLSINNSGNHSHNTGIRESYGTDGSNRYASGAANGGSIYTSSDGSHNHSGSVDIGQFNSGSTGASSVDVTMPYIQLLACQKS